MGEEELFDVLIPPGVPRTIIVDVLNKFDVQLVKRRERLNFANMDGMERDLLAFRGERELIEQVETFMMKKLREYVGET